MPTIVEPILGTITCDFISDPSLEAKRERVSVAERPGVPGYLIMRHGEGGGKFVFLLKRFETEPNVRLWDAAVRSMVGRIVTITEDWGVEFTNHVIRDVSRLMRMPEAEFGCEGRLTIGGVILP